LKFDHRVTYVIMACIVFCCCKGFISDQTELRGTPLGASLDIFVSESRYSGETMCLQRCPDLGQCRRFGLVFIRVEDFGHEFYAIVGLIHVSFGIYTFEDSLHVDSSSAVGSSTFGRYDTQCVDVESDPAVCWCSCTALRSRNRLSIISRRIRTRSVQDFATGATFSQSPIGIDPGGPMALEIAAVVDSSRLVNVGRSGKRFTSRLHCIVTINVDPSTQPISFTPCDRHFRMILNTEIVQSMWKRHSQLFVLLCPNTRARKIRAVTVASNAPHVYVLRILKTQTKIPYHLLHITIPLGQTQSRSPLERKTVVGNTFRLRNRPTSNNIAAVVSKVACWRSCPELLLDCFGFGFGSTPAPAVAGTLGFGSGSGFSSCSGLVWSEAHLGMTRNLHSFHKRAGQRLELRVSRATLLQHRESKFRSYRTFRTASGMGVASTVAVKMEIRAIELSFMVLIVGLTVDEEFLIRSKDEHTYIAETFVPSVCPQSHVGSEQAEFSMYARLSSNHSTTVGTVSRVCLKPRTYEASWSLTGALPPTYSTTNVSARYLRDQHYGLTRRGAWAEMDRRWSWLTLERGSHVRYLWLQPRFFSCPASPTMVYRTHADDAQLLSDRTEHGHKGHPAPIEPSQRRNMARSEALYSIVASTDTLDHLEVGQTQSQKRTDLWPGSLRWRGQSEMVRHRIIWQKWSKGPHSYQTSLWHSTNNSSTARCSKKTYTDEMQAKNPSILDGGLTADRCADRSVVIPAALASGAGIAEDQVKISSEYVLPDDLLSKAAHDIHRISYANRSGSTTNTTPGKDKALSRTVIISYKSTSVTHCLDILRQQLMCTVDIGVLGQVWWQSNTMAYPEAYVDFNTRHICRNFEDIRIWAENHQVPAEPLPDFLEPPGPNDRTGRECLRMSVLSCQSSQFGKGHDSPHVYNAAVTLTGSKSTGMHADHSGCQMRWMALKSFVPGALVGSACIRLEGAQSLNRNYGVEGDNNNHHKSNSWRRWLVRMCLWQRLSMRCKENRARMDERCEAAKDNRLDEWAVAFASVYCGILRSCLDDSEK
ncbi:hypothetical protein KCU79_g1, partial [Aureobasidium melanogenum]